MRRLLASLGLAVIVGGSVLGAAATLNLSPLPLSAGSATVPSCSTAYHTVLFGNPAWNGSLGHFVVGWVEVQNLPDTCNPDAPAYTIVLTHDGVALGQLTGTHWYGGSGNWFIDADFTSLNVNAAAVNGISVAIASH
jgi:hypothetical protein